MQQGNPQIMQQPMMPQQQPQMNQMMNSMGPNSGPPQMIQQQQPQQQHFMMQNAPPQQQQGQQGPHGPPGQQMNVHMQQPNAQMMPPQLNQRMPLPNTIQLMQQQQQVSQNQQGPPGGPQMMGNQPQQQAQMMNTDPMSALKTLTSTNPMPQPMDVNMQSPGMMNVRHQMPANALPQQAPMRGPSPRGAMIMQPGSNYMHPNQANQQMAGGNMQPFGSPGPMHAPSPGSGLMSNAGPTGHHMIPGQPAGQWTPHMPAPGTPSAPSPRASSIGSPAGNYINYNASLNTPNPSVHSIPSPASNMMAAPSPGPIINDDTRKYQMKLAHLQRFVEPLKRMIDRVERSNGSNSREMIKFKQLYGLIASPESSKVSLDVLNKCEQVLEKLDLFKPGKSAIPQIATPLPAQQVLSPSPLADPMLVAPGSVGPPINTSVGSSSNICQPLIDAIMANIKRPNFHSTLSRTFSPACAALGIIPSYSTNSVYPIDLASETKGANQKSQLEPPSGKSVLEGEIARLDHKFKVEEDPINHAGAAGTQIVVNLESNELPFVPPLVVKIPEKYPQQPPTSVTYTDLTCSSNLTSDQYLSSLFNCAGGNSDGDQKNGKSCSNGLSGDPSNEFFNRIVNIFTLNCKKLPQSHSLTTLLLTWEASVKQACSMHCRNV